MPPLEAMLMSAVAILRLPNSRHSMVSFAGASKPALLQPSHTWKQYRHILNKWIRMSLDA